MYEVSYFVADDGKRFEDAEECREYELNKALQASSETLRFYNYYGDRVDEFDECDIVVIERPADVRLLAGLCEYHGWYAPWENTCEVEPRAGVYWYNEHEDSWHDFNRTKNWIEAVSEEIYKK